MVDMKQWRKSKAGTIFFGVILAILGLIFCFAPDFSLNFITWIVGIAFLVAGAIAIINYFTSKGEKPTLDLILGIVGVVLGLIFLFQPTSAQIFVMACIGVFIFITGLADIYDAIQMNKLGGQRWGLFLALGILTTLFGIAAFVSPLVAGSAIIILIGIALIFDGVTEIVVGATL